MEVKRIKWITWVGGRFYWRPKAIWGKKYYWGWWYFEMTKR